MLKINDEVLWRGAWGREEPCLATVIAIERNCVDKDGTPVAAIPWAEVHDRSVILSLDNGHWCYGNQIDCA